MDNKSIFGSMVSYNIVNDTSSDESNNSNSDKIMIPGIVGVPVDTYTPMGAMYKSNDVNDVLSEQFKSKSVSGKRSFQNKDIIEHPFNFAMAMGLYKSFPFVTGAVDKFVDFIMSNGFYVTSEDANAQQMIEDFMKQHNFQTLLRLWIRDGILTGNGFMELAGKITESPTELKIINPDTMFVKVDDEGTGVVTGYMQKTGKIGDGEPFDPFEIAHLTFNRLSDSVYGLGAVSSAFVTIDQIIKARLDMHKILSRKANQQVHFMVGDKASGKMPKESDVVALGKKLEYMNEKTEWVTDASVESKVLDFGNIGDKFINIIQDDLQTLYGGMQVPEVLMGVGNIPEGIAKVQLEAFDRNVKSKQEDIETVVENKVFRRILDANGFEGVHVEFQWGAPSKQEENDELKLINEYLKLPMLNIQFNDALQKRAATLFGFEDLPMESESEERTREEEKIKQPFVPGVLNPNESVKLLQHDHGDCNCDVCESVKDEMDQTGKTFEEVTEDYTMEQWLSNEQFNYLDYTDFIVEEVYKYDFADLVGETKDDFLRGKFTREQVSELRQSLKRGFLRNLTIRQITEDITKNVKPKNLLKLDKSGKLMKDENGDYIVQVNGGKRSNMIARTETARLSAEGALSQYQNDDVEKVRYVAPMSQRTCPICSALHGKVFNLQEARNIIPTHTNCRCTYVAIIEGLS